MNAALATRPTIVWNIELVTRNIGTSLRFTTSITDLWKQDRRIGTLQATQLLEQVQSELVIALLAQPQVKAVYPQGGGLHFGMTVSTTDLNATLDLGRELLAKAGHLTT